MFSISLASWLFFPYFVIIIFCSITALVLCALVSPFPVCLSLLKRCYMQQKDMRSFYRQTIVILGTGWSSYRILLDLDHSLFNVIVVSPRSHFLFTPLLCSTTVGTLEPRSIMEPVYSPSFGSHYQFVLGEAIRVDFVARKVSCRHGKNSEEIVISYDRLVVGVGALPNTYGIDGVETYAHFLKEASQAQSIRNKLISNIQLALQPDTHIDVRQQLLSIVIVGGGPTGVEFAGELHDFLTQDVSILFPGLLDNVSVTIIERSGILAAYHPKLQSYVKEVFGKRSYVKVIQAAVSKVLSNGVILQDGSTIPSGLVVWCAGVAQRVFTKELNVLKNRHDQIVVDDHFCVQSESFDEAMGHRAYAVGDCAQIINNPLPCTAQVADREGRYLAALLNSSSNCAFRSTAAKYPPFTYRSLGVMAFVGGYRAIVDLLAIPFMPIRLTGFPAFFIWRFAYLFRLVSWRLRLQVPFGWLKAIVFGRDVSLF